jgi:hypothetical protein
MQTFLPVPDFQTSAEQLDWRRLGKQRVEAKQILRALHGTSKGWLNHPITKMWQGYEGSLCVYGQIMCIEWTNRGYEDNLFEYFWLMSSYYPNDTLPPWFGNYELHRSHQSNLVRKDPDHYRQHYPDVPDNLPYVWYV